MRPQSAANAGLALPLISVPGQIAVGLAVDGRRPNPACRPPSTLAGHDLQPMPPIPCCSIEQHITTEMCSLGHECVQRTERRAARLRTGKPAATAPHDAWMLSSSMRRSGRVPSSSSWNTLDLHSAVQKLQVCFAWQQGGRHQGLGRCSCLAKPICGGMNCTPACSNTGRPLTHRSGSDMVSSCCGSGCGKAGRPSGPVAAMYWPGRISHGRNLRRATEE